MNIADFFTGDLADGGVQMPLPRGQWVLVYGVGSKAHNEAKLKADRNAIAAIDKLENPTDEKKLEIINSFNDDIIAGVVGGWSFDEDCTAKNIKELFAKSSWIKDKVNVFAGDPENYLPKN